MKKILLPFFLLLSTFAFSQSVLDQKLDGSEKGKKLMTLFEELEKKHPVRFYFLNEWIDNISFQKKTHQVKGVGTIIKVEGGYKIKAPSVSRTSRCDYFVFVVVLGVLGFLLLAAKSSFSF